MKINRLKMQFDERKRKLIIFWGNLFCKKTFFGGKFVITGFNTGKRKKEDYMWLHKE
jgi:hypothetical protein